MIVWGCNFISIYCIPPRKLICCGLVLL